MDATITRISIKDETVKITVESDQYKAFYQVRLDDFAVSGLSLNQLVNEEIKKKLDEMHQYCYGFNRCLRKLAYQDKSEKEINNLLNEIIGLSQENKTRIIEELKSLGYLCDQNVAENQLYVDQNKLLGRKKTKYTLLAKGIDKEIVENTLDQVDTQQEQQRAVQKAKQLASKLKNKSYKEKIQFITNRLVNDGFEHVDEIVAKADIEKDRKSELSNLEAVYAKIKTKYEKKYTGRNLTQAITRYLYSKGYDLEMIRQVIGNGKEDDYED